MNRKHYKVSQNTEDWYNLRLGRFTASSFKDHFLSKQTKGFEKVIYKAAFERVTGELPESFSSEYMQRGHDLEPVAIDFYEKETFEIVEKGGFFTLGDWVGASPDGLVGENGIIEVKCPAYNTMINYIIKGTLPTIYKWQVYGQLWVTGRDWCDFIAYHPNLKSVIIRINRDEEIITELKTIIIKSIDLTKNIIEKIL